MADVLFDALGLARRLRDRAGFTPEHAEETAQAIVDAIAGPAVSKPDLTALRHEIRSDLAELRSEIVEVRNDLRREIAELRNDLQSEIAELRTEMRVEFSNVRSEVKAGIAEAKSDLARLILTVATGQLALLLAAMFSLARLGR